MSRELGRILLAEDVEEIKNFHKVGERKLCLALRACTEGMTAKEVEVLLMLNIDTIEKLFALTDDEIVSIKGYGSKTLSRLRYSIESFRNSLIFHEKKEYLDELNNKILNLEKRVNLLEG